MSREAPWKGSWKSGPSGGRVRRVKSDWASAPVVAPNTLLSASSRTEPHFRRGEGSRAHCPRRMSRCDCKKRAQHRCDCSIFAAALLPGITFPPFQRAHKEFRCGLHPSHSAGRWRHTRLRRGHLLDVDIPNLRGGIENDPFDWSRSCWSTMACELAAIPTEGALSLAFLAKRGNRCPQRCEGNSGNKKGAIARAPILHSDFLILT